MGVIKWGLPLLAPLITSQIWGVMPVGTLCSQDPDCIFYMDFKEGSGLTAKDQSRNGFTGTLSGGPVILDSRASYTNWASTPFSVSQTSITYCPITGHYLFFNGISGEQVTTPTTSIFDFSGNKPFMMAIIVKFNTLADNSTILNWDQSLNLCGWSLEKESNNIKDALTMIFLTSLIKKNKTWEDLQWEFGHVLSGYSSSLYTEYRALIYNYAGKKDEDAF